MSSLSSKKFSINPCSNNPQRWYVNFKLKEPFNLQNIKHTLSNSNYKVLADTPSVVVLRSEFYRLTWHRQGMIQVDSYKGNVENKDNIEHLINQILVETARDF